MICNKQEFAAFCKLKLCMTNLDINNFEVQWRLVHFKFKQLMQRMAVLLSSVGQFALRDVFLQCVLLSTKTKYERTETESKWSLRKPLP